MALRLLADFIRQCRLARWEEAYESADPLEVPPEVQISIPLLLCKGQQVKFKVCATANVTCWLQLDTSENDADPVAEIHLQNEVDCFAIDHEVRRTAHYTVVIRNTGSEPVDLTVEIAAERRSRSIQTLLEQATRGIFALLRRGQFVAVGSTAGNSVDSDGS